MINQREYKKLIEDTFRGEGICSSCGNVKNRYNYGFPRWAPFSQAPIVLVFEMPGRGEPLNEKEWKKKEELVRNIEKVTKIYYENMMLSWSGGRMFLDCIAEWLHGAEWVKNRTITEIFSHIGSEIYTTEVYKCHVDKKDKKCSKYLEKELKEILNPELIIAAGGSASRHVLKTFGKKHKKLGQIEELKNKHKTFVFMSVVHPSQQAWRRMGIKDYRQYLGERLSDLSNQQQEIRNRIRKRLSI